MASIYNSKKFNLVPPKTKEEEVIIEERDNSFFYSFILIFCAVIVFAFLLLAQTVVITPRIAAGKTSLDTIQAQLDSYNSLKLTHGEIYVKSQALSSILVQDIKLTQLLQISDLLKANITDAQIIAYSREATGQFVIDLRLDNIADVNQIFTNSEKIDVVNNLNLRSVSKQDLSGTTYIVASIGFNITNINNAQ